MLQLMLVVDSFCQRFIEIETNFQSTSASRDVIHNKAGMISVEAV
jgi:hypothetical protein